MDGAHFRVAFYSDKESGLKNVPTKINCSSSQGETQLPCLFVPVIIITIITSTALGGPWAQVNVTSDL